MNILLIAKDMCGNIPYEENSTAWHCWIDVCQSVKNHANQGSKIYVSDMMHSNGLSLDYYENGLSELLADGYITILD